MKKQLLAGLVLAGMTAASMAQETIKVGAIYPLSGSNGPQGQSVVKAIEAMAGIINAEGGVLGRKIAVVPLDDSSVPAVGVSRANEAIAQKVSVIFEGWNSPVTLAMQPVINRAGILDITTNSQADAIVSGEGNPLAIRMNTSNTQTANVMADILAQDLKAKKIAWMAQDDSFGIGAQQAHEAGLAKLGYKYDKVASERFPFAQLDFRIPLTTVRASNPDATVLISANQGQGLPALIRQARQVRIPGTLVASVGILTPDVVKLAGERANGILGADVYFPEVAPFSTFQTNQKFVKAFKESTGTLPDKNSALAAAAVQVWAKTANDLKTLDKEPLAKHIRGGAFTDTVMGDISFEANGQSKLNIYKFRVEDQQIKIKTGS